MSASVQERTSSEASPATVIHLPHAATHRDLDAVKRELAEHRRFLHGRYGDRWRELPAALGRPLEHAEALLAGGPIPIAPTTSLTKAITSATIAARAASAMGEIIREEGEVLEQALAARLVDLPLHRISSVVDAVLQLGAVPRPDPAWASPAAAHAANVLLDAQGDELRSCARMHQIVYAQFTDRVWDVPERRLQKGRRPWRPIAWLRLRRSLAAASRAMRAPSPLAVAADVVLDARALRARMSTMAPLLARHLGEHDRGPLTDVDAAKASLTAVRCLHEALGDRLDPCRLARLLAADAFRSDAVLEPARNLRTALRAWNADVGRLGGGNAIATHGVELACWAALVDEVLPVVQTALAATGRLGGTAATLRELVNDMLVRERFNDLSANMAGSAS
jgi:hypothetical protein